MEAPAPKHRLAGRYVLEELIDTGGMAAIWRARDEVLARADLRQVHGDGKRVRQARSLDSKDT